MKSEKTPSSRDADATATGDRRHKRRLHEFLKANRQLYRWTVEFDAEFRPPEIVSSLIHCTVCSVAAISLRPRRHYGRLAPRRPSDAIVRLHSCGLHDSSVLAPRDRPAKLGGYGATCTERALLRRGRVSGTVRGLLRGLGNLQKEKLILLESLHNLQFGMTLMILIFLLEDDVPSASYLLMLGCQPL